MLQASDTTSDGGRTRVARARKTRRNAPTRDAYEAAPLRGNRQESTPPHVQGKEEVDALREAAGSARADEARAGELSGEHDMKYLQ